MRAIRASPLPVASGCASAVVLGGEGLLMGLCVGLRPAYRTTVVAQAGECKGPLIASVSSVTSLRLPLSERRQIRVATTSEVVPVSQCSPPTARTFIRASGLRLSQSESRNGVPLAITA